jgi:hypothetical protein
MAFDPTVFEFQGIEEGTLGKEENFGLHKVEEGLITTSWHVEKAVELRNGDALFSLVFIAKKKIEDKIPMSISSALTPAAAYNDQFEGIPVTLQTREMPEQSEFALLQNQPNPFTAQTMLHFTVPVSADVTFTFTDVTGKIINEITGYYGKGTHQLEINFADVRASGIVLCTMKSGQFVSSRKMIRIE